MPSVTIDTEKTNEPGPLSRIARKLCCCRSSVKPESSVELTKAQTVTEQPTSSRISVVNNDVFEDNNHDFHSVELQVPGSDNKDIRKSANQKYGKTEKRTENSKRTELFEAPPVEEIPPDNEFLNVIEEASEMDASARPTSNLMQQQKNEHLAHETESKPDSKDPSTTSVAGSALSIYETTAPIENGDFKIYKLNRRCEATETADKPAVCSPQKPPRRASQLLTATSFKPSTITENDGTDVDTQCTNSTDDGIVPDIILTRHPDLEHESMQKLLAAEFKNDIDDSANKFTTAVDSDQQNSVFLSAENDQKIDDTVTAENTRTIATMAVDDTAESDYEDSLSTTVTDRSFVDDANSGEFVTRVSVRSNGDVLVSSPTFNGPVVKVKLSSISEDIHNAYTDQNFSENLV